MSEQPFKVPAKASTNEPDKVNLLDLNQEKMKTLLSSRNWARKPFRVEQIMKWLYQLRGRQF